MALRLKIERVNFTHENLPIDCSSVDSLSNVVDPNTDFKNIEESELNNNTRDSTEVKLNQRVMASYLKTETLSDKVPDSCLVQKSQKENNAIGNSAVLSDGYPQIPFPVVEYMYKNNPELCIEAEKCLQQKQEDDILNRERSFYKSSDFVSPPSPLRSLAAASEALALQHSVIGNSEVKPVSPEIVAQIVASTRLKLQQGIVNPVMNFNTKSPSSSSTISNTSNESSSQSSNLIRYPPESLSTTVERKSWFTNSTNSVPKQKSSSKNQATDSCSSSQSSISSFNKSLSVDTPSVHSSRSLKLSKCDNYSLSDINSVPNKSFDNSVCDTESCFSEKFESESVVSETFETESNISEISGMDDEFFQVKRLLNDINNQQNFFDKCNHNIVGKDMKHNGTQVSTVTSNANTSPVKINGALLKTVTRDQTTETDDSGLFEVIREKANLEGQLENIAKSQNDIMKERSSLQEQVTSLQVQLKSQISLVEEAISEKRKALQELNAYNKEKGKWESVIKEYQSVIESKDTEIKALKEDLSDSEQNITRSKINLEEMKVDMESKDGAIAGLKKKIAELHVEVQVALQSKIQLENEVKNVRYEMDMLKKSKEWYQNQLHLAQENRNKLHQELTVMQTNQLTLNNLVEKSKIEINNLKQQLNDTQQRAVKEKEMLMSHLETIEADMLERESLFDEIQKDKGSAESALLERVRKVEEEKSKLNNLMFHVSDLEHTVNVYKVDVAEKEKLIADSEKDKVELSKQVAVLQKTVSNKDLSVQQLIQDVRDANAKIAHTEQALANMESLVSKLNEEKTALDVALASANEEKRSVNESLKLMKENLNRIERNFKHMKADLVAKSSYAEQLLREKCVLEETLKKAEESILYQRKEFEEQAMNDGHNKDVLLNDIKKQKDDIENVLEVYSKDLINYQSIILCLEKQRNAMSEELAKLNSDVSSSEQQISVLNKENTSLRKQLEEYESLRKSNKIDASNERVPTNGKVLLESDLVNAEKRFNEKQKLYERNIRLLTRKLKEKIKETKILSGEIKILKEKSSTDMKDITDADSDAIKDQELAAAREQCNAFTEEIKNMQNVLKEQKEIIQKNKEIIIELEKEKGKVKAVSDSNETLKCRLLELEKSLTERNSSLLHLECQVKDLNSKLYEAQQNSKSKVESLEEELNKEKTVIKSLRQQIFQEKRTNSQLHRQLASLKSGLEQANQTADARKQEIAAVHAEFSLKVQAELKHRAEMEQLRTEISFHQAEVEKLRNELSEVKARDPALAEQLKSLSWHLKEKNTEIMSLKEKEKLMDESHAAELSNLQKSVEALQIEVEEFKKELQVTRKEKFNYQSKVTELRRILKSKLGNIKPSSAASVKGGSSSSFELDLSDALSSLDESYINDLLQRSMKLSESRPLSNLQACLNSLKQEMAELQKQLNDSVESSS